MSTVTTPAMAVCKFLGAETLEEKKLCLALAKECPEEAARILADMQAAQG